MKLKICSKCKKEKFITEFYKNKRNIDELNYWCKECLREYRQNNKEKIKNRNKQYYLDNKDRMIQQHKQYRRNNPLRTWATASINRHKERGYLVNITINELIKIAKQTKYCPICNIKLKWENGKGYKSNSPNLDRKKNEKILTLKNTQIICRLCNMAKNEMTMKEFINYCKMIANKF